MQWLTAATIALLLSGAIAFPLLGLDELSKLGDFLGGFAAAVAFLWLVASVRFQSRELSLQREELQLQRIALQRQAEELRNSTKFSSIIQIKELLETATNTVLSSDLGIRNIAELSTAWINGMEEWKTLLESRDAHAVCESYMKWNKVEIVMKRYLSNISFALKIYLEHNTSIQFDTNQTDEDFVFLHHQQMNKAPFLSEHAGTAFSIAHFMVHVRPGIQAVQLAGMTASTIVVGKEVFNQDGLRALKEELVKRGTPLPAIVQL
jgi:hypothetical protein